KTWKRTFQEECKSLYISDSGSIFAACKPGIMISEDNGKSWKVLLEGEYDEDNPITPQEFISLQVDEMKNILYGCSVKGLQKIELK
ncbi:hypothetical protein ACFL67_02740, partial [candidate division KSB1 bacterium]